MEDVNYQWIDNDSQLSELCTSLSQKSVLALDTEFSRSDTFYPHLGLLQVADDESIYLIDPLAITDKQPLQDLLTNPNIVKLVHACSEDIEVLQCYQGALPVNIFDTQIAAAFCGYGASIGYGNLVKETMGVDLPKQETRSDWMQRPLSLPQKRYAALDVLYLIEIYQQLKQKLEAAERLAWVESDCEQLIQKSAMSDDLQAYLPRVKSAWKLPADQLSVLNELCIWREQLARSLDVPRNRLAKDSVLFEIALSLPRNPAKLRRIKDIRSRIFNEYGQAMIDCVYKGLSEEQERPKPLPKPLDAMARNWMKTLKEQVVQTAESLSVPAEHLARKKDLEFLVRHRQDKLPLTLPVSLQGWRQAVVGDSLLDIVKGL